MALTNSDLNKLGTLMDTKLENQKVAIIDEVDAKLKNQKVAIIDEVDAKLEGFRSDFFDKIDPILKEVVANREERTIMAHYITELRKRVEKIEKRLGMASSS